MATKVTVNQGRVLAYLREHPGSRTGDVGGAIEFAPGCLIFYDRAHSILVRLHSLGLIERYGRPARWRVCLNADWEVV